ncbi:MFS transporter [Gordonia sp. GN26]
MRRAITASAIGNATEWYDYGVYAATTTYITQAFFPGDLGTIGTMLGFAISFVLRPLGGLIWGPLGDRIGRKAVLAMTIILISTATALIGILPTEAVAGIWAPILLILARVIQGFSTGGEYGGAATYMAEFSPDDKRGRFSSFLEFGTWAGLSAGTLFVLLLELLLDDAQMQAWGWRIPFLAALPLGLIGMYLRNRVEDSPVFTELAESDEVQVRANTGTKFKELLTAYWRPLLILFVMASACNVAVYTFLAFAPTYLKQTIGLSEASGSTIVLVGQLVMMALIPLFGRWSDTTGRKPMWWLSLGGLFVLAFPIVWLMDQGFVWAMVGFTLMGVLLVPMLATLAATFPAMFPTHVRFAGMAIAYNFAAAIFGGTAGLVNEAGVESTGWNLFPAAYMMIACAAGMVGLIFLKETAGASLRGTAIPERPKPPNS